MSEANREAISRRIRALLAKTTENGATEAEALAAAQKAGELMDAYRLTQTDIEITAEVIGDVVLDRLYPTKVAAVDICLNGIDHYCGVKSWFTTAATGARKVRMLGLKSDVEMASWLYPMLTAAISAGANQHYADCKRDGYSGGAVTKRTNSFSLGMASRINNRLHEMARAAETAKTGSGTALVVVKAPLVAAAFAKLDLHLSRASRFTRASDGSSYAAGRAAGDRVNLSRPLSSGQGNPRLG